MNEEYVARINRVIDYIELNLDQELSLAKLAEVSCFSPFHFHRIFKGMMGETLNQFITRLRLEKAASQLLSNPKKSITEIALDTGFSSSATFARSFKQYFGQSAGAWRKEAELSQSKNGKTVGKICEDILRSSRYVHSETRNLNWRIEMKADQILNIEVKDLPEMTVAYVRHVGPYKGDQTLFESLFNTLMTWAGPRGLMGPDAKVMAVYHDDPKVTEEDQLRVSACITVPSDTVVEGEIGKMTLAAGKYAVGGFELEGSHEYERAWDMLCGQWLPQSGFQPDDGLCFELYHNDPNTHPKGHHIVDICIPVTPL